MYSKITTYLLKYYYTNDTNRDSNILQCTNSLPILYF